MLLVTLRIIPIAKPVMSIDEPPLLTKGSCCPVTGISPVETPILIMACMMRMKAMPNDIMAPKLRGRFLMICMALVSRMMYRSMTKMPPANPYSSMMMA